MNSSSLSSFYLKTSSLTSNESSLHQRYSIPASRQLKVNPRERCAFTVELCRENRWVWWTVGDFQTRSQCVDATIVRMLGNVGKVPEKFVWFSKPKIKFRLASSLMMFDWTNDSPSGMRLWLHILHASVNWHRDRDVQQRWRRCHWVVVVLVVNLNISMSWFTLPIRDELKWTWLSAGLALYCVLQNVDVEVRCSWILFWLTTKQESECWHIELEGSTHVRWLKLLTKKKIDSHSMLTF